MYDLLLPPVVKGLTGVLEILKNNQTKSEASRRQLSKSCSENFYPKFLVDYLRQNAWKFCPWCFSRNFPKAFRTTSLKENLTIDVPCFIKEHLQMSAFDEATFKKSLDVKPPQRWPWKQNDITVVAAVMILQVVSNWISVLQMNILKPNHLSGNIFYHYKTRVTGVYMAYIFNRHSGGKASQIDCFESNLRSFECFEALWLLMDPSCKGTSHTRVGWEPQAQIINWCPKYSMLLVVYSESDTIFLTK